MSDLRCLLRLHHWVTKTSDDGGRYLECTRCGRQDFPDIALGRGAG